MDDNKVPFKLNGLVTGTISVISVIMNNTIKKIIFFYSYYFMSYFMFKKHL